MAWLIGVLAYAAFVVIIILFFKGCSIREDEERLETKCQRQR